MARLPFTKMQAVGNDFVVVDAREWPKETAWEAAAVFLCDRKFGIGSDGLLVVGPSEIADVRMRMFNPDGTEDMCGNGLRCVIHYARETGLFTGDEGTAECLPGLYPFLVYDSGTIKVNMGEPKFDRDNVPYNYDAAVKEWGGQFFLSPHATDEYVGNKIVDWNTIPTFFPVCAINTGSTHAVIFLKDMPSDEQFFAASPLIEHHPFFPERTSIMYTVAEPPDTLHMRIWERGAGETLGCGTGACAAAVMARLHGYLKNGKIRVVSKGGTQIVQVPENIDWLAMVTADEPPKYPMYLSGHAQTVYKGVVEYPATEDNRAES